MPKTDTLLLQSLRLIMRPLVRFCMRHSLHIQDFIEAGKAAFLDEAASELTRKKETVSLSRLATMSGIHRRDVTRIYAHEQIKEEPLGLVSRIIGQWQQDRRYLTRSRKPKVLTADGPHSEFAELVHTVSHELRHGTILYELERIGAVERTRNGVRLVSRIYNPRARPLEGMALVANDMDDMLRAVEENVLSSSEQENLHLKTQYDRIPENSLPKIREWFQREGSALHQKARNFLARFDLDLSSGRQKEDTCYRVALGTFSFISAPEEKNPNENT